MNGRWVSGQERNPSHVIEGVGIEYRKDENMINNDFAEQERNEAIEKAIKALEFNQKSKEKQPILGVEGVSPEEIEGEETADTPLPEETEDAAEKYIMESLFKTLGIPSELSILIPFDDAVSYKEKINALALTLAKVKNEAYEEGYTEGCAQGQQPPKEEIPEPAEQIAFAMGVKTPNIFRRR